MELYLNIRQECFINEQNIKSLMLEIKVINSLIFFIMYNSTPIIHEPRKVKMIRE